MVLNRQIVCALKAMKRAKHIDVRCHYFRHYVTCQQGTVKYDPSESNSSDGFTKPLARIKFNKFLRSLGLQFTSK